MQYQRSKREFPLVRNNFPHGAVCSTRIKTDSNELRLVLERVTETNKWIGTVRDNMSVFYIGSLFVPQETEGLQGTALGMWRNTKSVRCEDYPYAELHIWPAIFGNNRDGRIVKIEESRNCKTKSPTKTDSNGYIIYKGEEV